MIEYDGVYWYVNVKFEEMGFWVFLRGMGKEGDGGERGG